MPDVLFKLVSELASASNVRELSRSLSGLLTSPAVLGVALWRAGPEGELLHADGVPEGLLDRLRDQVPVGWFSFELSGRAGVCGRLMVCAEDAAAIDEFQPILEPLGNALERQVLADAATLRAGLFDAVTELVADGVIVATPDGEIVTYNHALERLTGWTLDDVRSRGWTNLVYPDPDTRKDAQQAIAALVLGERSQGVERELAAKHGQPVRARIWSRLFVDPAGGAPAMLGVMRSVASERTSRAGLLGSTGTEQLAGGVAHEFNNLLAAIMGHADLISLYDVSDKVAAHVRTIVDSATRGAHIASQILAYAGSAPIHLQSVELPSLVVAVGDLAQAQLPNGVSLKLDVTEVPLVEADPGALQQVLLNIVRNAAAAMPDGGRVMLEVGRHRLPAAAQVQASSADVGKSMVRLRIRDQGPGFSAEALGHLFVPFFSERRQGHGLGLAAVRGIVAAHQGAVHVHNDAGAIVDLYLPEGGRPEQELSALQVVQAGAGVVVWLVDDEAAVLEFSRISLEAQGYAVRAFDTVSSVLEALDAQTPDVLVLDRVMPEGGGEQVRQAAGGRVRHVLWTSGKADDPHRRSPEGYLRKPYTGRVLGQTIQAMLKGEAP